MNDDDRTAPSTIDTARGIGHIVRLIVIAVFIVALVVVALDNTDDVPIGYVFGDATAPVWIVVVASALGGIVIGWLFQHRPRRRD